MSWTRSGPIFRAELTVAGATIYLTGDLGAVVWAKPPLSAPILAPIELGGPEQWREIAEWLLAKADEYDEGTQAVQ